jgi:hypothetical protein
VIGGAPCSRACLEGRNGRRSGGARDPPR